MSTSKKEPRMRCLRCGNVYTIECTVPVQLIIDGVLRWEECCPNCLPRTTSKPTPEVLP